MLLWMTANTNDILINNITINYERQDRLEEERDELHA
jgi:hypothetical protein